MKQYKFEFEKFVKDLEERDNRHRENVEDTLIEEQNNLARRRVERYREMPQNQVVYNQERSDAK